MIIIGQAKDNQSVLNFANELKNNGLIKKADVSYMNKRKQTNQEIIDFEVRALF